MEVLAQAFSKAVFQCSLDEWQAKADLILIPLPPVSPF